MTVEKRQNRYQYVPADAPQPSDSHPAGVHGCEYGLHIVALPDIQRGVSKCLRCGWPIPRAWQEYWQVKWGADYLKVFETPEAADEILNPEKWEARHE